jgi:hypothetical protein
MALTDISGIGPKTAEKIRDKGITTKQELLRAFENNDSRIMGRAFEDPELNKRALDGIRDELFEQEQSFTDPVMGIPVGPENETAAKKLGTKRIGDLPSIDVTQANAGDGGNFYADQTLGELAEPAAEGELGEKGAPQSLIGFASDAAANLGVSNLGSGQIQDVNSINANSGGFETTAPSNAYGGSKELPEEATEKYELDAREVARAESMHEDRSPKAQRVDERKKAPVTDEIGKWSDNPSHWDYPGVDTQAQADEFFVDKRSSGRGLGSTNKENRDKRGLRNQLQTINQADDEVQEQALGESVDFSLGRLFSE